MIKCPCKQCISYVMCRNREYRQIMNQCELINHYIMVNNIEVHKERCRILEEVLKPLVWALSNETKKGFDIILASRERRYD